MIWLSVWSIKSMRQGLPISATQPTDPKTPYLTARILLSSWGLKDLAQLSPLLKGHLTECPLIMILQGVWTDLFRLKKDQEIKLICQAKSLIKMWCPKKKVSKKTAFKYSKWSSQSLCWTQLTMSQRFKRRTSRRYNLASIWVCLNRRKLGLSCSRESMKYNR